MRNATTKRSMHVGDSIRSDVRGALEVGMHAVHLDVRRARAGALVVHAIDELPDLLSRLDARPV